MWVWSVFGHDPFQAASARPPASGSDVVAGGRGIGTVVSAAAGACLAVLPLEREPGPLQAEGIALHDRPLLGGLAR